MTEAQAFLQYIPFDREFKPTKKESQIRPNMIENFEILIQKKTRLILFTPTPTESARFARKFY